MALEVAQLVPSHWAPPSHPVGQFGPHVQAQMNPQNPSSMLLSGPTNQIHVVWPGPPRVLVWTWCVASISSSKAFL